MSLKSKLIRKLQQLPNEILDAPELYFLIYKCACGNIMDSDFNAACNILFIGEYGLDALQPNL